LCSTSRLNRACSIQIAIRSWGRSRPRRSCADWWPTFFRSRCSLCFALSEKGNWTDRQLCSAPNAIPIIEVRAFSERVVDDEILRPILPYKIPTRHISDKRRVGVMMPIQATVTPISCSLECIESTPGAPPGMIRYHFRDQDGSVFPRSNHEQLQLALISLSTSSNKNAEADEGGTA
jgi:hypothetical protein